jgi:hypothetical protein
MSENGDTLQLVAVRTDTVCVHVCPSELARCFIVSSRSLCARNNHNFRSSIPCFEPQTPTASQFQIEQEVIPRHSTQRTHQFPASHASPTTLRRGHGSRVGPPGRLNAVDAVVRASAEIAPVSTRSEVTVILVCQQTFLKGIELSNDSMSLLGNNVESTAASGYDKIW